VFGNLAIDSTFNICVDSAPVDRTLDKCGGLTTFSTQEIRIFLDFLLGDGMDLIGQGSFRIRSVVGSPHLFAQTIVAALFLELEEKCIDRGALFLHQGEVGDFEAWAQGEGTGGVDRRRIGHQRVSHACCAHGSLEVRPFSVRWCSTLLRRRSGQTRRNVRESR
jgi:hypothetical protein